MIGSFADKDTESLWATGKMPRRLPPELKRRALDRLQALNAATKVEVLRFPPSNHLEKLSGDRAGQWSIRINDQWRIAFTFEGSDAHDVEIVDYH
jgi:proteic killer suppression protein